MNGNYRTMLYCNRIVSVVFGVDMFYIKELEVFLPYLLEYSCNTCLISAWRLRHMLYKLPYC